MWALKMKRLLWLKLLCACMVVGRYGRSLGVVEEGGGGGFEKTIGDVLWSPIPQGWRMVDRFVGFRYQVYLPIEWGEGERSSYVKVGGLLRCACVVVGGE